MENTDENIQDPIVNTDISSRNTENVNDSVTQQQDITGSEVVADFTAGPFVTRRNPTAEITSMISSLYISDDDKSDDDDDGGMLNVGGGQNMQTDIEQIKVDLLALSSQVQSLKQDFQQSIDSAINRENSFREAVDASFAGMEEYCQKSLEKLEKAVIDCFLRRDAKWESQWKKLRPTSTPTIARLQAYTQATSYLSSVHLPKNPVASRANVIPPNNTYAISSVSAPQLAGVTTAPYAAGSSSFCARPPIRLEFPSFDGAGDTADVLNFIEQCENFLDLRPLSSIELLGTLSSVLSGPALSW